MELERLIALHRETKFFNASMSGARIAGAVELSFDEILKDLDLKEKPSYIDNDFCRDERTFEKFLHLLKDGVEKCELFTQQIFSFMKNLREISKENLELEILQKIYENIENFNAFLNEEPFLNDGKLNHVFIKRGELKAELLKKKLEDDRVYLLNYIEFYEGWLEFLLKELGIKKSLLSKTIDNAIKAQKPPQKF